MSEFANIPMQFVGPIKILGPEIDAELSVPLATFETPLWPSTKRGARVSVLSGGIQTIIIDERMTRSVTLEAPTAAYAKHVCDGIYDSFVALQAVVSETSDYAKLIDWHKQIVGNLIYLRFEFTTGDASGHNMVTKAADHLIHYLSEHFPQLNYVSISGNYCTDKKASAVNGILGRGKYVVAELMIPREIVKKYLKSTPEKIVDLNIKKNLIGTTLAGGIRSANAHFANILLAFYLATGQDAANIIEGSQGIVHTEVRSNDLYFSVTIPNIIVGTVGNGKGLDFVKNNLDALGCLDDRQPGQNARRLALIIGATVLCGELSLLAAQTNQGELMDAHLRIERAVR